MRETIQILLVIVVLVGLMITLGWYLKIEPILSNPTPKVSQWADPQTGLTCYTIELPGFDAKIDCYPKGKGQ